MKIILVIAVCCTGFFLCGSRPGKRSGRENNIAVLAGDKINFQKQVEPIFQKNCSPCHFPGGKLYDRLPFDKDTTIINHQAGILKRIKNAGEVALIKKFVSQNSKEN